VAGLLKTQDIPISLAVGMLNAESVIGHFGAKKGLLKRWPSGAAIKTIPVNLRPL
jgi:hypothetical protein